MLAKSIIAGTVLSLMAGGIVYFGTDIGTTAIKEKEAEKTAEVKADISGKTMLLPNAKTAAGEVIEAQKPTVSYESKPKKKGIKTTKVVSPEESQKKWLNQYLKSDTKSDETAKTAPESQVIADGETSVAKGLMESMGLTKDGSSASDTGTFIVKGKITEPALVTENIRSDEQAPATGNKNSTRKMLSDILNKDRETTVETETINMGDGKTMKIVKKTMTSESHDGDGKKMRIEIMTDDNHGMTAKNIEIIRMDDENVTIDALMKQAKAKDISRTVKVVMEQAEKIDMPELRDRAYLDLVSYGLKHGNYEVASDALAEIQQVELRDTARNCIAVAYAKDGNAEDAFAILENIEVDALRDVMRLQVIEEPIRL